MKTSPHRERYQLLIERRRALLELRRLEQQITAHPAWSEACRGDAALPDALTARRDTLDCDLCSRACQAGNDTLLCDLRRIYRGLVDFARVWVALEERRPVRDALAPDLDSDLDPGARS